MPSDQQRFPIAYGDEFEQRKDMECKLDHDHYSCEIPPRTWRSREWLAESSARFRAREAAPEAVELLREMAVMEYCAGRDEGRAAPCGACWWCRAHALLKRIEVE